MIFDHIGIFVKSISFGRRRLKKILDIVSVSKEIKDKKLGVIVQFLYDKNNICYEIVAPYKKNNPVDNIIKSKKNILNHIAYKVENIKKKNQNIAKRELHTD